MKFLGWFFLFLFLSCPLAAGGTGRPSSPAEQVREGFALYRKGKYREALASFQGAFREGFRDGRLEYDMGNCWWRLGDKAKALVHYERAREWMPRDPDVLANLRLCRKALGVDRAATVPFLTSLAQALSSFTLGELLAMAAGFSVLCFFFLGLYLVFRRPYLGWISLFLGLCLLLFGGLGLARLLDRREYALVTVDGAKLVAEPREGLAPVAVLGPGLEVEVLGEGGAWTQVEAGGRKGWLPAKDLGFLDWRKAPFRP